MTQRTDRARRAWTLTGHLSLALWGLAQALSPLLDGFTALPAPLAWLIGYTATTAALMAALGLVAQNASLERPALILAIAAPVAYLVTLATVPAYNELLLVAGVSVALICQLVARIYELAATPEED